MKKYLFVLLVCVMAFAGCEQNYTMKFSNPQQQNFDDFLAQKRKETYQQNNDIQRKEFYAKFEKALYNYVDTCGLFVNWKGVISDIETEESGKTTALKFTITYKPEKYREVKFHCTHLIETKNLNSDYIYNMVKNMPNYMVVYFDGFIRTKNSGEVYYKYNFDKNLHIPYPDYEFWPIEIGPEERNNTLPTNLNIAVNICYDVVEPLRRNYLGEITKEQSDSLYNLVAPKFKEAKSQLTEEENGYISRLTTALTYNYLYGGNN